MKVAHLLSSISRANGGISESVRRLAQTQAQAAGAEIRVFSLRDRYTDEDRPAWRPLEPECLPVRGPRSIGYAPDLARALAGFDAEVSHAAGLWMYPSLAQFRWARRAGRPYVISPHGMLDAWALRNSAWKKKLAAAFFQRRHLEGAACLHALCDAEAKSIRACGLRNPVCVIPNGIDPPRAGHPGPAPWAGRFPGDASALLFLGRLHPKKGLRPLLQAWAQVRNPDWRLVVVGWDQGGHRAELESMARALGIDRAIVFLGPLHGEQKAAAYANARAFVLPSLSEGLPMTILEAWAYGLPVLMTEACNLPEGFAAGAAAHLPSDPDGLADGLGRFLALPPEDLSAMGRRGRALAGERFDWNRLAGEMGSVYRWVAGQGPQPDCVQIYG